VENRDAYPGDHTFAEKNRQITIAEQKKIEHCATTSCTWDITEPKKSSHIKVTEAWEMGPEDGKKRATSLRSCKGAHWKLSNFAYHAAMETETARCHYVGKDLGGETPKGRLVISHVKIPSPVRPTSGALDLVTFNGI